MSDNLVIGICGGSGAGKTTFIKKFQVQHPEIETSILGQDHYYRDQSANFDHDGGAINFDHPDAIDFDLLTFHAQALKHGIEAAAPIYDFHTHKRAKKTQRIKPAAIIFVDGILLLCHDPLVQLFDFSIYIDMPENIRFERRIHRDQVERGRNIEGINEQIQTQVKPMHTEFVEANKSKAQIIINNDFSDAFESILKINKQ
jgi:uridine kinase